MRNCIRTMLSRLMLAVAAALALTSCGGGNDEPSKSSKYVTTFTTGSISRFSDVYLILSEDVADSTASEVDLNDVMSISPSTKGVFSFVDNHTIVFRHTDAFERDTKYRVKAKISKLFNNVPDEGKNFVFEFSTLPLGFAGDNLIDLETTEDEASYILTFKITSADIEDSTVVMSDIYASEGEITLCEEGMSSSHTIKLTTKAQNNSHDITISSKTSGELCKATVPGLNEISVYEVVYKTDDASGQTYAEVTFSKKLSTEQNMEGLIYIEDNQNKTVDVTDNKARLYPDGTQNTITIVISGAVKSDKGVALGNEERHTVTLKSSKPDAKFESKGVIIPLTNKISIPFSCVSMKGVRVRIFKVFKNNMNFFMQNNQLSSYDKLAQFGEPIAVKTIYFDEKGNNLMQWHTYAIDLSSIMKAEPGTLYRIELELDKNLSAWPGVEDAKFDKSEIARQDAATLKQLREDFNSGNMWYSPRSSGGDWWYDSCDDPTKGQYYTQHDIAGRNILATNIGLTVLSAGEGKMRAFTLNLPDASPSKGVNLKVYSVQNQLIGTFQTDENGMADIAYNADKFRPHYIVASSGDDITYLRIANGENLSTSTFDIGGETVYNGVKCFLYGERGVWRPGDIIHLTAMVQSTGEALPENHPVKLELRTPLGILYKSLTSTDSKKGIYTFNIQTDANDPTGTWVAKATIGSASFTKNIRLETIKPNRLKIDLDIPEQLNNEANTVNLHTEWLTGAKADKLEYTVKTTMVPTTTTFAKYKGYCFDNPTLRKFIVDDEFVTNSTTDSEGNSKFVYAPKFKSNAPGMLSVNLETKVFEPSGEYSTDVSYSTYSPYKRYVGILSPQKKGDHQLDTDKSHKFSVVCVDTNGKPQADVKLKVGIYKVEYWWWWSNSMDNEIANYTSCSWNKPYKDFVVTTQKNGTATFTHNVDRSSWGVYLIEVSDIEKGHSTGTLAYFDWPEMTNRNDTEYDSATKLYVSTDKEEYSVGDSIKVSFPSSKGAKAIVNICRGTTLVSSQLVNCGSGKTSVSVLATDEMRPNVYAIVSLVQPYANSMNDTPLRLYGIARAKVSSAASHLYPQLTAKEEVRPEQKMSVTVSEKSGRPMAYTLAVVDEGLLDLTHFKTPRPWDTFNATEALGIRMWDMYSLVAGAYGGKIEQMFSIGGDESLFNANKAIVNRFTPMVYFDGPFSIEKGEQKTHNINVPNYTGRVRVMVVASDGSAVGEAEKSVKVTKPLMILGTMPRQIGVGDKSTISASVFTDKAMGNVTVSVNVKDGVKVIGSSKKTVTINSATCMVVPFEIEAGNAEGEATVSFTCSAKGESANYTTKIKVRKEVTAVAHTEEVEIKPGSSWSSKAYKFDPTSTVGSTMLELSTQKPLNLSGRVNALIRYPHGCAEQTTSKILAQLYLSEFSDITKELQKEIESNIKSGISKLSRHATSSGGVAYWEGSSVPTLHWSAYVYLFYTEAETKGYYVETSVKSALQSYLRKEVRTWNGKSTSEARDVAFALYALANANLPESGAMNRLKELLPSIEAQTKDTYYKSEVLEAYNWLAAAYACIGTKSVAKGLAYKGAQYSDKPTRLIVDCRTGDSNAKTVAEQIRKNLVGDNYWMSTYETGLSIMAWHQFAKNSSQSFKTKANVTFDGGTTENISTGKMAWTKTLTEGKTHTAKITNTGTGDLYVMMTTEERASQSAVPANASSLQVTMSGMPASAKAGDTFKVQISVMNPTEEDYENVAISFIVPAGVEISGVNTKYDTNNCKISNTDTRDDRVYAYIDNLSGLEKTTIEVTLSATYAGDYYSPAVDARLMYNDKIQGNTASGRFVIK